MIDLHVRFQLFVQHSTKYQDKRLLWNTTTRYSNPVDYIITFNVYCSGDVVWIIKYLKLLS